MNKALYKQYDSRWGSKPYPYGSTMSGCGCGCVACTHIVIEQYRYKDYTPENLRPWMVNQGFAIRGQGTTWAGITKTLQHYGYNVTYIGVGDSMEKAWKELNKGNRIGIILFSGGCAPNGTVWTAGGHYVAFTDYYVGSDGRHYFYTKDSGGRNHDSVTNGAYSYERSMKGLVSQMWIVERVGKQADGSQGSKIQVSEIIPPTEVAEDGRFGPHSVQAAQKVFGVKVDGQISGQNRSLKKYFPGISEQVITYGKDGSNLVKAIQAKVGISAAHRDGVLGRTTIKALQEFLGTEADGIWGTATSRAFQKWINKQLKASQTTKSTKSTKTTTTITTEKKVNSKVIDVSYVQSTIDWDKVKKDGVEGAIIRCGYRGYASGKLVEDDSFVSHITKASKAGIKVGVYFFTEAINAQEGKEEADFALKLIQRADVSLNYPIAVDTERINANNVRANNLSKTRRTEVVKAFCEEIKANGFEPMIYASTDWLNNQLDMNKLPYKVWVAQYNDRVTYKGSYIMWQYTSKGRVNGINQVVDLNHCYIKPTVYKVENTNVKTPQTYTGKLPELHVKKSVSQVINDTIAWGKMIAADNSFHYGYTSPDKKINAHHNGCYFCGTNTTTGGRSKRGVVDYEKTYCCNPFVHACWAHGGQIPTMLSICQRGSSYDFSVGRGYDTSPLFKKVKKPKKSALKAGDVLCKSSHVALYIGSGKLVEAASGDDNIRNSKKWNESIRVDSLGDKRYATFPRIYRLKSGIDADIPLRFGELSNRVKLLQRFLNWYNGKTVLLVDGMFGTNTLKYVKAFQVAQKITADGVVGKNTLAKMKTVKK